jgi:hypothetical protein
MADDDSDGYKITLAQQIFGKAAAILGSNPLEPKANDVEAQVPPTPARDIPPLGESSSPGFSATGEGEAEQKQLKTATASQAVRFGLGRVRRPKRESHSARLAIDLCDLGGGMHGLS